MKKFEIGEKVWISYQGRVYPGVVNEVIETDKEGLAVRVLTEQNGFRTVLAEDCSYEKPKRKTRPLSVKRAKS